MTYFYIVLIVLIIVLIIYLHLVRNFNYWKNRNVSYIKPIPFFGNVYSMITFQKSLTAFLDEIHTKCKSRYFGFFVFDQPFLLVKDIELIKRILISDFDYFSDRSVVENKHDKHTANFLFLMQNPDWKVIRTKSSPAFSSGKLKNMIPLIVDAGEELVDNIKKKALNKEFINCRDSFMQYAVNVISSCAYGFKARAHEESKFSIAAENLLKVTYLRGIEMVSHFFAPTLVKLFKMKFINSTSATFLEGVFLNTLEERMSSQHQRGDFIDLLIKMGKDTHLDKSALMSMSLQYLMAGYETAGSTIAFVLYEMSLNKSIQVRLRNEILAVLKNYNTITLDAIQEMTYLDMVVKETLRKYPLLPFLDRRCTKDYKIPNSDLTIEKGIPIYISVWSLHHDENYYPDPTKFDPERFSLKNKSNILPCTYLPFGEGYRNCIGAKFGMVSVCVAIIQILKHFQVEMSANTPETLTFELVGFLTTPKGSAIHVKFRPIIK